MNETQPDFGLVSEAERKISMSGSELCRKCLTISSNLDDPRAKSGPHNPECWKHDYHEAFGELESSCKAGCPLCQTFFFLLAYDGMVLEHTDILHWSIKRTWGLWSLSMRTDALSGAGCAWTLKDQADDSQPSQSITTVKSLSTSTLNEDLEALLDESINQWVEACTNSGKHHSCPSVAPHESYSYSLPTRLIDVGTDGAATVRLVDTDDISRRRNKPPYTILSYRWGSANDSAMTTSRNLKERFRRINSKNLPKTIRDAIKITQFMKIRYLWVDAVCIIQTDRTAKGEQGDDESRIDWERESTQMASYYANSLCCIAASSAKDSSDGILSERRVARYQKWYNPPNVSIRSPFAPRRKFPSSLFSRGWCLQEWILSPRIIHWTANGLVWECSEGFFWEGQSGFMGEPPQTLSSGSEGRRTNDCVLELGLKESSTKYVCRILRSEKDEALEGWTALVEHYATMDLSFLSDRDAAISGIVSVLSKRHGEDYFAGVFRSYCGQHLLWRSDPPRRSLDTSDNFPTWSWLSSKDEIRFNPIESSDCSYWMKSLGPFPSSRNGRTLTHITNKELCFTAPLIKFDMLDPGDADSKSPYYFEIGPKSPFWQGLRFTAFIDSLSSLSSLKSRAFLLILRQRLLRGTVYEGLIVQVIEVTGEARAFQDVRESYRRVGTFSIHYQQWETLPELPDLEQWMTRVVLV